MTEFGVQSAWLSQTGVDHQVLFHSSRKNSDLERYAFLTALQDRNETAFYALVSRHLSEMMPIIYTPVVDAACQAYSRIYHRPLLQACVLLQRRYPGDRKRHAGRDHGSHCHKRTRLRDQRVVILRAGSAAAGIAGQLLNAMMTDGLSAAAAKERVWLADSRGLVHDGRNDLDSSKAGNASSAFEERITARMWTPRYLPYRRVTAALQD